MLIPGGCRCESERPNSVTERKGLRLSVYCLIKTTHLKNMQNSITAGVNLNTGDTRQARPGQARAGQGRAERRAINNKNKPLTFITFQ